MKLFKVESFEPEPSEEFFLIKEFEALYTLKYNSGFAGDTQGRNRLRGLAEAKFIFFYCDHKSEFAKYDAEERKREAIDAANLPEDYKISDVLEAAMKRYEKLSESRNLRLLKGANAAVDKLTAYLNQVDFTTLDSNGKFLHDPKDLISNIGNLGKIIEGLEKLEEAVRKDEGEESSTRGSAEKGRLS